MGGLFDSFGHLGHRFRRTKEISEVRSTSLKFNLDVRWQSQGVIHVLRPLNGSSGWDFEILYVKLAWKIKYTFFLLYPRHKKYMGVYSFRFSVRLFVRSYVRSFILFVFPSQGQSFCVKVYKTSYFEDPLMDFVHIWHDGRYRSKVFISTIPTPGMTLGSRSRT